MVTAPKVNTWAQPYPRIHCTQAMKVIIEQSNMPAGWDFKFQYRVFPLQKLCFQGC